MVTLTKDDILRIHDCAIEKFGGEYGIREEGTFDMLCNAPYQSCFGCDLFPTIYDKAAKFAEGFSKHQVFYDGNKRTAFDSMLTFLRLNGKDLTLSKDEAYDFVMEIANSPQMDCEAVSAFLRAHTADYIKTKTLEKEDSF